MKLELSDGSAVTVECPIGKYDFVIDDTYLELNEHTSPENTHTVNEVDNASTDNFKDSTSYDTVAGLTVGLTLLAASMLLPNLYYLHDVD